MKITIRQKGGMEYLYADISVSSIRIRGTIGISLPKLKWDAKNQKVKGTKDLETTLLVRTIRDNILESIRKLQREARLSINEVKGEQYLKSRTVISIEIKDNNRIFLF